MHRLLFALVTFISVSAESQVQRYDRQIVREKLLAIARGVPEQQIRVEGTAGPREKAFLDHYVSSVHPRLQSMKRIYQRRSALNVLIDTASYDSAAELEAWRKEFDALTDLISGFRVDARLAADVARWGELARGLTGDLADYARQFSAEHALYHFPEEMRATLTEVDTLHQQYKSGINGAPSAKGLGEFSRRSVEISRGFKAGELSFAEAREQIDELNRRVGFRYVGFDAVQAQGEALNRLAVLRTQLALSKGFATWSEYQLAASGLGYAAEYRGVVNQRRFLHTWIAQLRPLAQKYIDTRLREMNLESERDNFKQNYLGLLNPADLSLLQPYFPNDQLTSIWEQTMYESGFSRAAMAQIIFDDAVREGKNPTMAYMSGMMTPEREVQTIHARTLNIKRTRRRPGQMYIMQTFRGAGLGDLSTAFHEGTGHAAEYLLKDREDLTLTGEAYGYVEVPSMTAEYFTRDPEYLFHKAVPVNGEKPTVAQIAEWAKNSKKASVLSLIASASSALFDTDIWDYDYAQGGAKTYVERLAEVAAEVETRAGTLPAIDSAVPAYYSRVASTHFTSGLVRNIGYTFAHIGSRMMFEFISDELERETGRRSWYQQPGLAKLLVEKFYRPGWRMLFPLSIEQITGQPFSPEKVLKDLGTAMDCGDLL